MMATRSTRYKHVRIQFQRQKLLKKRSKRGRYRKNAKKSRCAARALITANLLKQNTRVSETSIGRIAQTTVEKISKNKTKQKFTRTNLPDQRKNSNVKYAGNYPKKKDEDWTVGERILPTSKPFAGNSINPSSWKKSTHQMAGRSKKRSVVYPINEQHYSPQSQQKKKQKCSLLCTITIGIFLSVLIAGITIAIVVPLTTRKDSTSSSTTVLTSTLPPICTTSNYTTCSTIMFHNLNSLFTTPGGWTSVSCCYISPTMNQLTIEIAVQEDTSGHWLLDDISASQGRGELISNGGFEYNITNWTLTIYPNATSATEVIFLAGSGHTGNAYLYGSSVNAPVYVQQTFSIIPNENILINFWWDYLPALGAPTGISELTIRLS